MATILLIEDAPDLGLHEAKILEKFSEPRDIVAAVDRLLARAPAHQNA